MLLKEQTLKNAKGLGLNSVKWENDHMLQETIGVCGPKVHSGHRVEDGLKRETAVEGRKSTRRDKSRKDQIQD